MIFRLSSVPPGSKYAFGVIAHGVQIENTIYVTSLDSLHDASASWRKIADVGDEVTDFDIHGDHVYLLSHHEASRFKILGIDLPKDEVAHARVLMAASDAVVTGIQAAADALYVQKLDGGLGKLWRLPYEGGTATEIRLPFEGAIQEIFVNPTEPGVFVRLASWTKSSMFFHYDPKTNTIADTKIIPVSPVDFSGIESEEVKVKAADGTMVPLSIVHQRGLKMDGSHPTLLHGYGSYGYTLRSGFRSDFAGVAGTRRGSGGGAHSRRRRIWRRLAQRRAQGHEGKYHHGFSGVRAIPDRSQIHFAATSGRRRALAREALPSAGRSPSGPIYLARRWTTWVCRTICGRNYR